MLNLKEKFKDYIPGIIGPKGLSYSSVVLPIIKNNEGMDCFLLELRSSQLKRQPGEVSLPGGRIDKNELSKDAALREFCEELETDSSKIEIICKLDSYFAPLMGLIDCYLGQVNSSIDLSIKNDEVEELFLVPIQFFIDNQYIEYTNRVYMEMDGELPLDVLKIDQTYNWGYKEYPVIYWIYEDKVIWGLTANIIRNFIEKLIE
ncbi:NUDIX hydrolase [Peptostreptococcus equinus]|uniref:CoA pyrophosphatase n=1 Tax=Peptostreptococcus equinus TaxID=3003601 RepID=A0ABY7JR21_9FIRM|nr:CoA pyrophosphatase [Peptostreptococcus sp. CBA3647]WAW15793.1 CoA pyrophosphatase [Peptostreptococcus sp. CBA3647]